jgi:hypothetical protein
LLEILKPKYKRGSGQGHGLIHAVMSQKKPQGLSNEGMPRFDSDVVNLVWGIYLEYYKPVEAPNLHQPSQPSSSQPSLQQPPYNQVPNLQYVISPPSQANPFVDFTNPFESFVDHGGSSAAQRSAIQPNGTMHAQNPPANNMASTSSAQNSVSSRNSYSQQSNHSGDKSVYPQRHDPNVNPFFTDASPNFYSRNAGEQEVNQANTATVPNPFETTLPLYDQPNSRPVGTHREVHEEGQLSPRTTIGTLKTSSTGVTTSDMRSRQSCSSYNQAQEERNADKSQVGKSTATIAGFVNVPCLDDPAEYVIVTVEEFMLVQDLMQKVAGSRPKW